MRTTLFFFTGTGNSLFIAKSLAEGLGEVRMIPITGCPGDDPIFLGDEVIGVIYPTYFLDVPEVVKSFLLRLQVSPESYLFLFANYGAQLGNALHNGYQLLQNKGNRVKGLYHMALPDNSIIFPTDPKTQLEMLAAAKTILQGVLADIRILKEVPPPRQQLGSTVTGKLMLAASRSLLGFDQIRFLRDRCNHCGTCSKVCSSCNIAMHPEGPMAGSHCTMCFACIHHCPREAVRYRRMKEATNYRYRHPEISVRELIEARREAAL